MSLSIFEVLRSSLEEITKRQVMMIDSAVHLDGSVSEFYGVIYLSINKLSLMGKSVSDGFSVDYNLHMLMQDPMCGVIFPSLFSIGLYDIGRDAFVSSYSLGKRIVHNLLTVQATSFVTIDEPDIVQNPIKKIVLKLHDDLEFVVEKEHT